MYSIKNSSIISGLKLEGLVYASATVGRAFSRSEKEKRSEERSKSCTIFLTKGGTWPGTRRNHE